MLSFGFAGALRRSELVALRVEDVVVDANGLRLRILRGKTDQGGTMLKHDKTDYCGTHSWLCGLCTEETKRLDAFVAEHVRKCQGKPALAGMQSHKVEITFGSEGQNIKAVCRCGYEFVLTHWEHN